MPNLIPLITVEIPAISPSRACSRVAVRNRRAALKSALWSGLKIVVTLAAIFVKELLL